MIEKALLLLANMPQELDKDDLNDLREVLPHLLDDDEDERLAAVKCINEIVEDSFKKMLGKL